VHTSVGAMDRPGDPLKVIDVAAGKMQTGLRIDGIYLLRTRFLSAVRPAVPRLQDHS
jgi:hypothetical protein